jgi:hypothetical protein
MGDVFVTTDKEWFNAGKFSRETADKKAKVEEYFVISKGEVKKLPDEPSPEIERALAAGHLREVEGPVDGEPKPKDGKKK